MDNPRDPIDDWLNTEVEPLAPPPATFRLIRRRARRRKVSRAVMSAAAIVVVAAAGVAVPRIAASLQGHAGPAPRPAAAGQPPASARPEPAGKGGVSPNTRSSSEVSLPSSALSAAGSGAPVPPNFQPTSVTFVGTHIGAVIGQAGTPGHCATAYCTSLAGTSDYGSTWYGVSAPLTGPPDGPAGVGQIRFLNTSDGWAFGPQLWVTHDGGATWTQEDTGGMRVTDLETAGDRAFALFAACTGSGAGYGARCTAFSLYTSLAGSDHWEPVSGPVSGLGLPQAGSARAASASLVLTEDRGYLLAPSGELLSGPLTGGAWTEASDQVPCLPGAPGPDGQPAGALLAADAGTLVLVCASATDTATDSQTRSVTQSTDNGVTWSTPQPAGSTGIAASVASQGSTVLIATSAGIYLSADSGGSWALAQASPAGAAAGQRGFSYVGMTSSLNGVALPADAGLHEVFITTDGGRTWQAHAVSAP